MYIPRLNGKRNGAKISAKTIPPSIIQEFSSSPPTMYPDMKKTLNNKIKYTNKCNHNIKIKKLYLIMSSKLVYLAKPFTFHKWAYYLLISRVNLFQTYNLFIISFKYILLLIFFENLHIFQYL